MKSLANSSVYFQLQNYRYSKVVDTFINDMLDRNPEVVSIGTTTTVRFKNKYITIWTGNKWYAYGSSGWDTTATDGKYHFLGDALWHDQRPKRRTLVRLYEYLQGHQPVVELTVSKLIGEDINNGQRLASNK